MTFRESLNAFADHVLDKAVGTVEAGACVPSAGQLCACLIFSSLPCWANQHKLNHIYFSCHGVCRVLNGTCCA